MPGITTRLATEADIPACAEIYRHHVQHGSGTFEMYGPDDAEMQRRYGDVRSRGLPWLVALDVHASVRGFAYANWFRPRDAYRFAVEDSIYVAAAFRRSGIGRILLEALVDASITAGARQMVAVIGDAANTGSIGLHSLCGFEEIGRMRSVGRKFDRWLDVVLMQRALGPGDTTAPA
jgi:phosphinothricin acetyltransferase